MESRKAFGLVLKMAREKKNQSQEDFSNVSSRTYVSTLERGLKSPTLDKIDALSSQLGVHPLTLLLATFAKRDGLAPEKLARLAEKELAALLKGDK